MNHSLNFHIARFVNRLGAKYVNSRSSPQEMRSAVLRLSSMLSKTSSRAKCTPIENDQIKGEWLEPKEGSADFTLLYLHGGGYIFGSPSTYQAFLSQFCWRAKARILSLDYPLAPEHPYPAAIKSAYRAYKWLLANGTDPKKIVVGGDSAGGGLALALLLKLKQMGDPLPAGALCICPWVDLSRDSPEKVFEKDIILTKRLEQIALKSYVIGQDPHDPLISPIFGDFTGMPPIMMQVATLDSLNVQDLEFADRLKKQGVQLKLSIGEGMFHDWAVLLPPQVKEGLEALNEMSSFIHSVVLKK